VTLPNFGGKTMGALENPLALEARSTTNYHICRKRKVVGNLSKKRNVQSEGTNTARAGYSKILLKFCISSFKIFVTLQVLKLCTTTFETLYS
jgi:hypothetical protein